MQCCSFVLVGLLQKSKSNMEHDVKKIDVNLSSLIDLKAELYRKQEQFKKEKLQNAAGYLRTIPVQKKPTIWSKKNAGVLERNQRDLESKREEEDELEKSRESLQAKTKLYEKMTRENFIPEEEQCSTYLVDFERKAVDKIIETREEQRHGEANRQADNDDIYTDNPDEEWIEYTDSLGRSRRCMKKDLPELLEMDKKLQGKHNKNITEESSMPTLMSEDMRRELVRQKWEKEEEETLNKPIGPLHYANVQHKEIRTHGVGFYQFGQDESSREEQMKTLEELREQTLDKRAKRDKLKEKRKAILDARLAKVRQRRQLKEAENTAETEAPTEDSQLDIPEKSDAEERQLAEERKKQGPVREWDKDKPKEMTWERKLQQIRDDRQEEFAPPTFYYDSTANKQNYFIHKPATHCDTKSDIGTCDAVQNDSPEGSENQQFAYLNNLHTNSCSDAQEAQPNTDTAKVPNVLDIPLPDTERLSRTQDIKQNLESEKEQSVIKDEEVIGPPMHLMMTQMAPVEQLCHTDVQSSIVCSEMGNLPYIEHTFTQPSAPSTSSMQPFELLDEGTLEAKPVKYNTDLQKARDKCSIDNNEDAEFYSNWAQDDSSTQHASGSAGGAVNIDGVRLPLSLPLPPMHGHLPPENIPSVTEHLVEYSKQKPGETHKQLSFNRMAQLGIKSNDDNTNQSLKQFKQKNLQKESYLELNEFQRKPEVDKGQQITKKFEAPSRGLKRKDDEIGDKKDYAYKMKFTPESIGNALKYFKQQAQDARKKHDT